MRVFAGKFRGSVTQVACGAHSVQLDVGSILYRDEGTGVQYEAKYGNCRLAGEPWGTCDVGQAEGMYVYI